MKFNAATIEHRQRLRRTIESIDEHEVGRVFSFSYEFEYPGRKAEMDVKDTYAHACLDLLKLVEILIGQRDMLHDELQRWTTRSR
jgi:hypothetical protein